MLAKISNNKWIITCTDSNDSHTLYISISNYNNVNMNLYGDNIFINSKSYNSLEKTTKGERFFTIPNANKQDFEIYVNKICIKSFGINIKVLTNNTTEYINDSFSYIPNIVNISDNKFVTKMNMPDVSYSLLRANPKLTGNVKLVIDSNNDLFLDVFKISTALSNKKYRKIAVNTDTYYGQTLCAKFKDVPISDFYKVEDKCYDLYTTAQKYNEQYYDIYNYGVRTNSDKLYNENFSLLAPLCIKNVLPDFFLIFKVNNEVSTECETDKEKIEYFIKNGKLIKSYDLRDNSKLGKYIRNIQDNATNYPGDGFLTSDLTNHNKFIGISLDKGVVTSIYESTFGESEFGDSSLNAQVEMNNFYTTAFERNHLVSKDIINIEYMFNDLDSSVFSINTYFGIYVKVNTEESDFSYLDDETFTKEIHTFYENEYIDENYPGIIYGLTTPNEFIRLNQGLYGDDTKVVLNDYKLKPYKNILSVPTSKTDISKTDCKSYLTLTLSDTLEIGEHLRIISPKNKVIYEIIVSNDEEYNYCNENNISEITHNIVTFNTNSYDVFKISIHSLYRKNVHDYYDYKDIIKKQIKDIYFALNQFSSNLFYASKYNDDNLSIVGTVEDLIFERLCADSGFTEAQEEYISTADTEDKIIKFFGSIYVSKSKLDISDTAWENFQYCYLYPFNVEITGNRIAYIIDFYNIENDLYTGIINDNIVLDDIIVYKSSDEYKIYDKFNITAYKIDKANEHVTYSTRFLQSYLNLDTKLVNVINPDLNNNAIKFYNLYPINSGICSLLNIKDYVYDVLDDASLNNSIVSKIGDTGEYTHKSDNAEKSPLTASNEEILKNYFIHSTDIVGNDSSDYITIYNKKSANISLLCPYCCKWEYIGTDARCDNLRVMYDFSSIKKISNKCSYYVVADGLFDASLGYLYDDKITTNETNQKYILNTINDVCSSNITIGEIFKNRLLSSDDIAISDLLYNSNTPRFSTVYSVGNESIEFISGGVKIRIETNNTNIIDLIKYQDYKGVLLTLFDGNISNNNANEIIIDEAHREIVVIYYVNAKVAANDEETNINAVRISYNNSLDNIKFIDKNTLELPYINGITFNSSTGTTDIIISSYSNNDNYTKDYNVCLSGTVENSKHQGTIDSIIINNPTLYVDGSIISDINGYTFYQYHTGLANNVYLIGNLSVNIDGTKSDFNGTDGISIFIKTKDEIKDYSSLDVVTVSIIDAFIKNDYYKNKHGLNKKYYTHSGYIEPLRKNMLIFNSDSSIVSEVSDIFEQNFKFGNILIDDVNYISQIWFKKYTEVSNYCNENDPKCLGIDVKHDYSILYDSLLDPIYNKYFDSSIHIQDEIYGYESGYNTNTFLSSKGIVLKNDESNIEISIWKDTEIIDNKCIKLNISDSVIYYILHSESFIKSLEYLQLSNDTYKINYIKNVILPLININNKNVFKLYKLKEFASTLSLNTVMNDTYELVENVNNELQYENSKYYMYVYPDDITTYSAKMIISL